MKKLVKVDEVNGEGLVALMGERVLLMCAGYFYEGLLVGVSDTFVKLEDPGVVYSTGDFKDEKYTDLQKLHTEEWYVQRTLIESFGKSKNG